MLLLVIVLYAHVPARLSFYSYNPVIPFIIIVLPKKSFNLDCKDFSRVNNIAISFKLILKNCNYAVIKTYQDAGIAFDLGYL
jgi:hypothetical protein